MGCDGLRRQNRADAAASQFRKASGSAFPLLPNDGAQPSTDPLVKFTQHRWRLAEAEVAAPPDEVGSERWQQEQTHPERRVDYAVEATEPQDALRVGEPHLDLLALTSRLLKALGASKRPGDVSGMLMDVARDLAERDFRTA